MTGFGYAGRRGLATLAAAALILATAPGPARADDSSIGIDIWNGRGAYGGPATVQFILTTGTAGFPLMNDTAYAAAAEHGLARIDLLADGVLVGTTTGQPWTVAWDPSARPEAPVRLTARSYDRAGHSAETVFTSKVDHTAPKLKVHQNGFVRAGGEVAVEATDASGFGRVELLAGDRVVDSTGTATSVLHWDRSAVDGPAALAVRARDIAGNVAEFRRAVLVDNDAPAFGVTPAAGASVRGTVAFTATGVRDASGLGSLEVRFSGTWFGSSPAAPRVARVDTRRYADGKQVVQCVGYDRAGNTATVSRTVTVDNHAPAVSFAKAPKNKGKVRKNFTVTAKATDRFGVARVQLLVDGKVVATDTKASYRFTVSPKKYGKKFTVLLRAYDKAGNVRSSSKRTYRR